MREKIAILYNSSSGSNGVTLEDIREAFERHRQTLVVLKIDQGIDRLTKKVRGEGVRLIVAAGGDGTVNAAARVAVGADIPMAVLPLGTLNHFAQDIGVPTNLDEAVRVIFDENLVAIDYCTVNEHIFLNSSCIGLYPMTVVERGKLEPKLGKRLAKLIATIGVTRKMRATRLEFQVGDKRRVYKTPLVFVGNNSYEFERVGFTNRNDLSGGRMFIYVVRANRVTALLRLLIYAFFGRRLKGHDFLQTTDEVLTVDSRKSAVDLSVDGEVKQSHFPLVYTIHPKALNVFMPDSLGR